MKTFLIILLILVAPLHSLSQDVYTIPYPMMVSDVSGNSFLASALNGDELMIHEYDVNGNLVWKDSTTFLGDPSEVYWGYSAVQYPGTDEYILIMVNKIGSWTTDGPAEYHFVKFSLTSQSIILEKFDTLLGQGLYPMGYRDTSIFLFNKFNSPNPDEIETLDLDENLNISLYASQDSMESQYCANITFYELNDTIFRYCNASPAYVSAEKFTTSISFQGSNYFENYYDIWSTLGNSQVAYLDTVGVDSVLLVYQTTYTGPVVNEWYFVLFDYELNVINSLQISVPMAWGLYNDLKNCIVVGESIYVLANVGSEPTTIFEYDFNFDLQCAIPVGTYEFEFALVKINDFAYFRKKELSNYKFYQIQNCDFTSGIISVNSPEIYIYPNPTTDNLMIQRNTTDLAIIEVYDIVGNLISAQQFTEANHLFNVSALRPGTYILRIKSGDDIVIERIVKQ